MSQYPPSDQPPSYDSVFNEAGQEKIGVMTNAQPAESQVYPILPSAPMMMPQPNQNYGSISEVTFAQPSAQQNPNPIISDVTTIVVVNGCPICRIGVLEDDYGCLGICLAIFCFPIGILCCLACKNKRCSSCGAVI